MRSIVRAGSACPLFAKLAALWFALAFIFSCSSGGGGSLQHDDDGLVNAKNEAWVLCNDGECYGYVFKQNGELNIYYENGNRWELEDSYYYSVKGNKITTCDYDYDDCEDVSYSISGNKLTIKIENGKKIIFTRTSGLYLNGGGGGSSSSVVVYSSSRSIPRSSSSVVLSSSAVVYSSSSIPRSSSSVVVYSSSSMPKSSSSSSVQKSSSSVVRPVVNCDLTGYRTVKIGTKTWMAENLNCDVAGSVCYNNSTANCNKYGRLYDWESAKAACSSGGWRLPNIADWHNLLVAVGGDYDSGDNGPVWEFAGKNLKATSGWYNNGNGNDIYEFAALPGGLGWEDGDFDYVGKSGFWWKADYDDVFEGIFTYRMDYYNDYVGPSLVGKDDFASVRCVKD